MEKLIYNFFNKSKGAISVFLTIILVPMMTITCMFVDASRIKLARAVLESSGDLALNTILSDYDADLAEIYGLMASSQNTSDAMKKATDYFKSSMVSQGLDEETAGEFAKLVSSIGLEQTDVEDIDVYDLLGIATDSVTISPVDNGTLVNPAILKSQIVEFSKYRAPIEGIKQLCELFNQINTYVENSKTDTEIIEEQTKFYNAENEVLANLVEAYDILKKIPLTKSIVNKAKDKMSYANNNDMGYKSFHHKVVYGLYNFSEGAGINFVDLNIGKVHNFGSNVNINNPDEAYRTHKTKLINLYTNYKSSKSEIEAVFDSITYSNAVNDVEYWLQLSRKLKEKSPANNIPKITRYVELANRSLITSVFSEYDYMTKIMDKMESPISFTQYDEITLIIDNASSSDEFKKYNEVVKKLSTISSNNFDRLNGEKINVNNGLNDISVNTADFQTKAKDTIVKIDQAMEYIRAAETALTKMQTAHQNWGSKLTDEYCEKSELAKNNKTESYDKIDQEVLEKVNTQKLSELKTRLENIRTFATNSDNCVENAKYYGKKISEISTISNMTDANKITNSNPYLQDDLSSFDNAFADNFTKFNIDSINIEPGTKGNNPDLSIDTPELYSWMKEKAENQKSCEYSKEQVEDLQSQQGTEAKQNAEKGDSEEDGDVIDGIAVKSNFEISNQSNLPSNLFEQSEEESGTSDEFSTDISKVSDSVGGIFGGINLNDVATNFRDQLYEMYYITSMFSYDTYEYEIKNEIVDKYSDKSAANDNHHTLLELPAKYGSQTTNSAYNEDFVHCTPTNVDINIENNNSYGNELEYILYGGTNVSNKAKAYGTIFAIRYAFNLIYAFSNFWTATKNDTAASIEAVAEAIALATCGVVPAALTKTIFILALTAAESAYDIACLKMGMPVAVVKMQNPNTWKCQLPTRKSGARFKVEIPGEDTLGNHRIDNNDLRMRYSDFLKLFLFIKIVASEDSEKAILTRTADVIQVNMQKQKDVADYYLMNSVVYYKLSAKCKTSFLLLPIPIIKNYTDSIDFKTNGFTSIEFNTYRGY